MPNIFSITKYFYLQEEQQAVQVVEGLADGRAGDAPLVDGGEPERQYSTVHCNHCIIAQHSTVQYSTVQYSVALPERHLRHLGPGGLDHLRLVQADPPPLHSAGVTYG